LSEHKGNAAMHCAGFVRPIFALRSGLSDLSSAPKPNKHRNNWLGRLDSNRAELLFQVLHNKRQIVQATEV
jgi:hypothetical protein